MVYRLDPSHYTVCMYYIAFITDFLIIYTLLRPLLIFCVCMSKTVVQYILLMPIFISAESGGPSLRQGRTQHVQGRTQLCSFANRSPWSAPSRFDNEIRSRTIQGHFCSMSALSWPLCPSSAGIERLRPWKDFPSRRRLQEPHGEVVPHSEPCKRFVVLCKRCRSDSLHWLSECMSYRISYCEIFMILMRVQWWAIISWYSTCIIIVNWIISSVHVFDIMQENKKAPSCFYWQIFLPYLDPHWSKKRVQPSLWFFKPGEAGCGLALFESTQGSFVLLGVSAGHNS